MACRIYFCRADLPTLLGFLPCLEGVRGCALRIQHKLFLQVSEIDLNEKSDFPGTTRWCLLIAVAGKTAMLIQANKQLLAQWLSPSWGCVGSVGTARMGRQSRRSGMQVEVGLLSSLKDIDLWKH